MRGLVRAAAWAWRCSPRPVHGAVNEAGRTRAGALYRACTHQPVQGHPGAHQAPAISTAGAAPCPSAGCWTITVTIGGDKVGAITLPVAAAAART